MSTARASAVRRARLAGTAALAVGGALVLGAGGVASAGGGNRPPRLSVSARVVLSPADVRPEVATVVTRVAVDEPAKITVSIRDPQLRRRLVLLPGTRTGAGTTTRPRTAVRVDVARARELGLSLRLTGLRRGRVYELVVAAADAEGKRTQLALPFRVLAH